LKRFAQKIHRLKVDLTLKELLKLCVTAIRLLLIAAFAIAPSLHG